MLDLREFEICSLVLFQAFICKSFFRMVIILSHSNLNSFPPNDKRFYEYPNPRFAIGHDGYMEFALGGWEDVEGVYRKVTIHPPLTLRCWF